MRGSDIATFCSRLGRGGAGPDSCLCVHTLLLCCKGMPYFHREQFGSTKVQRSSGLPVCSSSLGPTNLSTIIFAGGHGPNSRTRKITDSRREEKKNCGAARPHVKRGKDTPF
jgi:hypothetical protein